MFGNSSINKTWNLHWNGISSSLYYLILILQKSACYVYMKILKFWHTQTKMGYWTKDPNLFLNVVILLSIYDQTIKLLIDILFNTFCIVA